MPRSAWRTWFAQTHRLAMTPRLTGLARSARRFRWATDQRSTPRAVVPTGPATPPPPGNRPSWADATVANPQVGRAGRLTLAQSWRANGGRW